MAKADPKTVTVQLRRERTNAHDLNAVEVIVLIGDDARKLGYLPAAADALIAPLMDAGYAVRAALQCIVGGWAEGMSYGARVNLSI